MTATSKGAKSAETRRALDAQLKLKTRFRGPSGAVGEELYALQDAECLAGQALVSEFHGFVVLFDSFQSLVLRSFDHLHRSRRIRNAPQLCHYLAAFRTFRASFCLCWKGYTHEATGMLRTVGDSVIVLAAYSHEVVPAQALAPRNKRESRRAANFVLGAGGEFTQSDREEIFDLYGVLCEQVHGSKLTSTGLLTRALEKRAIPSPYPYADALEASHYVNVALCYSWLLTRLLWTVVDRADSAEWVDSFDELDDAFRANVATLPKALAGPMTRFVDAKFAFRTTVPHPKGAKPKKRKQPG